MKTLLLILLFAVSAQAQVVVTAGTQRTQTGVTNLNVFLDSMGNTVVEETADSIDKVPVSQTCPTCTWMISHGQVPKYNTVDGRLAKGDYALTDGKLKVEMGGWRLDLDPAKVDPMAAKLTMTVQPTDATVMDGTITVDSTKATYRHQIAASAFPFGYAKQNYVGDAPRSIALDNICVGFNSGVGTSLSFNCTVGASSTFVAVGVGMYYIVTLGNITGVELNSIAASTKAVDIDTSSLISSEIWYWNSPSTGSNLPIVITADGNDYIYGGAISLNGTVATLIDSSDTDTIVGGTTTTLTQTTIADNVWTMACGIALGNAITTYGAGQTSFGAIGDSFYGCSYKGPITPAASNSSTIANGSAGESWAGASIARAPSTGTLSAIPFLATNQ